MCPRMKLNSTRMLNSWAWYRFYMKMNSNYWTFRTIPIYRRLKMSICICPMWEKKNVHHTQICNDFEYCTEYYRRRCCIVVVAIIRMSIISMMSSIFLCHNNDYYYVERGCSCLNVYSLVRKKQPIKKAKVREMSEKMVSADDKGSRGMRVELMIRLKGILAISLHFRGK